VTSLKPQWFQILLALSDGPLHGAGVMAEVLERTAGEMRLWPATLYGSLRDLEDAGWIREIEPDPAETPPGGKRRVHELTAQGQHALRSELHRMRAILEVARQRDLLSDPEPRGA
jgi:DNA-binding PadR family transcriptional regulator